jgi:tRNA-splicing ligase RtcB
LVFRKSDTNKQNYDLNCVQFSSIRLMSQLSPKKVSNMVYRIEPDKSRGMRVPVTIYADEKLLEKMMTDRTIMQAVNVSTLPGIQGHAVVLPDGHEGYGFPVGGVAAMDAEEGMISPGGVGYDINCGVRLLRTNLTEQDVRPRLKDLVTDLFNSIPSGVGSKGAVKLNNSQLDEVLVRGVNWAIDNGYGSKNDAEVCEENGQIKNANPNKVSDKARKRGMPQLGSLGSGNHFLEVQKVAEIFDENAAKKMGIEKNSVTILIHCGSRGFGHQVCSDYLRISEQVQKKYNIILADRELACVPNKSEEGESYRTAMFAALNFAWSNRQMITHWTRKSFERVFKKPESDLDMKLVYDVAHNIAKVEKHKIDGQLKSVVVHRKGATRAFPANREEIPKNYRDIGQPVLIPGSMGTSSWILLGKENSMNLSFGSTAHGAGRMMSRSKARRDYTEEQVKKSLADKGIVIKSLTRDGVVEETPQAYKDVDAVVNVSHDLGIATKVAKLVPIGVIKG